VNREGITEPLFCTGILTHPFHILLDCSVSQQVLSCDEVPLLLVDLSSYSAVHDEGEQQGLCLWHSQGELLGEVLKSDPLIGLRDADQNLCREQRADRGREEEGKRESKVREIRDCIGL
jgi:hypothetical protein